MTVVSLSVKNAAAAAAPSTSKDGVPEVNTAKASAQYYRDALTRTLTELGWRQATGFPSPRCAIVWHDEPLRLQHLLALPRGARINRFYGMVRICRKVCLARLLDACGLLHPAAFGGAAPRTWCVGASWPQGAAAHRAHCDALKDGASAAFIVKPDSGCQGAGIRLVRGHAELAALLAAADAPPRAVVQEYLERPLLLDGYKFDLRLYVILTSAAPLRAYLSTHGVARFATHAWAPLDGSNQDDLLMHLSNSSINTPDTATTGVSNKWHLKRLWARMEKDGHDAAAVWAAVRRVAALALAAMQPVVAHTYASAFPRGREGRAKPVPGGGTRASSDARLVRAYGGAKGGAAARAAERTAEAKAAARGAAGLLTGGGASAVAYARTLTGARRRRRRRAAALLPGAGSGRDAR